MTARVLYTADLAERLLVEVRRGVKNLENKGVEPALAVVLVGEDPASALYVSKKREAAESCGIDCEIFHLPAGTPQRVLNETLSQLGKDERFHGLVLQLPLPEGLSVANALDNLPPTKDVDGLTPLATGLLESDREGATLLPATPLAVLEILAWAGVEIKGKHAVVVGRSNLVGRPLCSLLAHRGATVTSCHIETPKLTPYLALADIVVCAAGCPNLVRGNQLKTGAVVIDVGIHREKNGKICGDAAVDCLETAAAVTPVPGGVGPVTVACLLRNVVKAATLGRE